MIKKLAVIGCLSLLMTKAYASSEVAIVWADCRPTAQVRQYLKIKGVELNLKRAGFKVEAVNNQIFLSRRDTKILIGNVEKFDLSDCQRSSGLTSFSERVELNPDLTVVRNNQGRILCLPEIHGLIYTGYTVDWYRKGQATVSLQTSTGGALLSGNYEEHFYTREECKSL